MTDGGSTIGNTLPTPEAFINDGLRTLDNVLPHLRQGNTVDDTVQHTAEIVTATNTIEDDQADGLTIREDEHVVGALERVRSFVKNKRRLAGVVGTMGVAVLAPAVSTQAQEVYDYTKPSQEEAVESVPDTYPLAQAPIGSLDDFGYEARTCGSFTRHMAISNGVESKRAVMTYDLNYYRKAGEQLDTNPAPGSVGISVREGGGHSVWVVAVSGDRVIYSEYNGRVPNGYYAWSVSKEKASNGTYTYVHFELPNNKAGSGEKSTSPNTYLGAKYDRRNKDAVSTKRPVKEGSFIQSKDGKYRLVVNKGDIKLHDSTDDSVAWKTRTNKQASQLQVKTGKGNQRGKNTLVFGNRKKDYKKWNIGSATLVEVGNDGTLAGYKGNKRVWVADELAAVSRAAKQSMSKIASVRQKALGR